MSTGLTCFLIDDDEDDREIFAIALADVSKSHECTTATNGKEALEKLNADETFIPDFIFLDLNMPLMDGKQFLLEVKKISRLSLVPVVIYSTSSHQKDIEETKQLGAAYFLTKLPRIDDLSKILSALFQKQPLGFSLSVEFTERA